MRVRFSEWSSARSGSDVQLRTAADADEFLSTFFSPCAGTFWTDEYAAAVKEALPAAFPSNAIHVWNIGCGKGYETLSFACILKGAYPDSQIKIWANDNDVMAISQAPNMTFEQEDVPEYCRPFVVKGKHGFSFNQAIKDSIVFEYHDVLNDNPLPDLDVVLIRDVLSFFSEQEQNRLVDSFAEKLKNQGLVILGKNEALPGDRWVSRSGEHVSAFMHNA